LRDDFNFFESEFRGNGGVDDFSGDSVDSIIKGSLLFFLLESHDRDMNILLAPDGSNFVIRREVSNGIFRQDIDDSLDENHGLLLVLGDDDILEEVGLFSDIHSLVSIEDIKMGGGGGPVLDFEFSLAIKGFFHPVDSRGSDIALGDGADGINGGFSIFIVDVFISLGL